MCGTDPNFEKMGFSSLIRSLRRILVNSDTFIDCIRNRKAWDPNFSFHEEPKSDFRHGSHIFQVPKTAKCQIHSKRHDSLLGLHFCISLFISLSPQSKDSVTALVFDKYVRMVCSPVERIRNLFACNNFVLQCFLVPVNCRRKRSRIRIWGTGSVPCSF